MLVGPGRRFWNFLDWPTSVREHHLRFHARIVVVFSIHITKNLEGQITRAMGGGHAVNPKLVLHAPGDLRNVVAIVGEQMESALNKFDRAAEIIFGRSDNVFHSAMRAAGYQNYAFFSL